MQSPRQDPGKHRPPVRVDRTPLPASTARRRPGLNRTAAVAVTLQLGPALMAVPSVTRFLTRRIGPGGDVEAVRLTFDDGPHPDATPAVLDVLAEFGVRATFFLIGEQVQRYPATARMIAERGHGVAVHGWTHQLLPTRGPWATVRDIHRAHEVITQTTGTRPRWYRPPYGAATGSALVAARALGLTPVWWTSHGRDWAEPDPDAVTRRILRLDRHGRARLDGRDVLLLHDSDRYASPGSWRATVAALPRILTGILATGRSVGPLA